ncbi:MAG: rod-binding protein [Clostridia bacterium]|nr:rod-binding protein [Clostridia bacterium]
MKIDGIGQSFNTINPTDKIDTAKSQTETSGFQDALQKAFSEGDKTKLKKVCNEFESVMLQMLYKQMKATVPNDGLIEKSNGRAIFEDMLDQKLMDTSSQRGMGISEMMYKQLSSQMDRMYKTQPKKEATPAAAVDSPQNGTMPTTAAPAQNMETDKND